MNKSSDHDTLVLLFIGGVVLMALASSGAFALFSEMGRSWMLEHQILVTDSVLVPDGGGAGLDLLRVVLIAACVLLALVAGVAVARSRKQKQEASRR